MPSKNLLLLRRDSQIVITFGYATQTHWLTVVREYIEWGEQGLETPYAEMLFQFWENPFYKAGGVGPVPE